MVLEGPSEAHLHFELVGKDRPGVTTTQASREHANTVILDVLVSEVHVKGYQMQVQVCRILELFVTYRTLGMDS